MDPARTECDCPWPPSGGTLAKWTRRRFPRRRRGQDAVAAKSAPGTRDGRSPWHALSRRQTETLIVKTW